MEKLSFRETVKAIVRTIPRGEVRTYKQIAELASCPNGARAVARLMARNFDPTVPCHRVIRSDGALGGYNRGGLIKKRAILEAEGYQHIT